MKTFARLVALAVFSFAGISLASAQQASNCQTPSLMPQGRMNWFGGFSPSDDLLTAWCRLQTIPGNIKFNVLFPQTKVNKAWETKFEGENLPATKIVDIIQTLLPTAMVAPGPNEMAFYRVLENVVQAGAEKAPDGIMDLGFVKSHPSSRELMLWEPVVLQVKPVVLAGQPFTLSVVLRPNLGMFSLTQQKQATDVKFIGAKDRMNVGNKFTKQCSSSIPYCEDLGDVVTFHAPWVVTGIRLETVGENLTNVAMAIMSHMGNTQFQFLKNQNPLNNFNMANGSGAMELNDGVATMRLTAKGDAGGTKSILIIWEEEANNKQSMAAYLRNVAISYRTSKMPTGEAPLPNQDILNRL